MSSQQQNPDKPDETGADPAIPPMEPGTPPSEPGIPPSEPGNLPDNPDVVPGREGERPPGETPDADMRSSPDVVDLA
jgi:hypothetical protein